MNKEFIEALNELEKEKRISKDLLLDTIENALVSAYRKNYGTSQNVRVVINPDTGDVAVLMRKDIVEEVEDEMTQMSLDEAMEIDPRYEIGDAIEFAVEPRDFGRIAATTAKQVVVQRLRETERKMIYDEYVDRQGEIVTGVVQRRSNNTLFVNIGRTEGILSAGEQVPGEHFRVGDRLKVYIMDVKEATKGPQVFLSRSHPGLVERLFELDYFDPDISEKDDSPYYVKERAKEPAADIGYFAVDLSGNITEQKRLKTYDEIVKIDSFFKYDADHAMKAAADHFSADYDDIRSTAKYLDEIDGKEVLCYRVQIKRRKNDKFILLNARINGENGEIFYTDEFEFIDGTWQKKEG